MYLHIGNGKSVKDEEIVGIFDLDSATVSGITKSFINKKQKAGLVDYYDSDLPRSFVLTSKKGEKSRIRLSRISVSGLMTRVEVRLEERLNEDN